MVNPTTLAPDILAVILCDLDVGLRAVGLLVDERLALQEVVQRGLTIWVN